MDSSTPIDGLGGLGVSHKFLSTIICITLLEFIIAPIYRQDITWDIAFTNCCEAHSWWLEQPLNSQCPTFVSLSTPSGLVFSYLCCYPFSGTRIFCSFNAPDKLILFVAVFIFGAFTCEPNMEIHPAWNWVKFIPSGPEFLANYVSLLLNVHSAQSRGKLGFKCLIGFVLPWGPYANYFAAYNL